MGGKYQFLHLQIVGRLNVPDVLRVLVDILMLRIVVIEHCNVNNIMTKTRGIWCNGKIESSKF